jgi:hypothetical protein
MLGEIAGSNRKGAEMRLSWRDWLATVLVVAASIYYAMFAAGTALLGASNPKLVAGVILAFGFVASFTAVVYGAGEGLFRANKACLAVTSLLGLAALVAGLVALFTANEVALGVLAASTAVLWAMSTVRHAMKPAGAPVHDARIGDALPGGA